MNEASRSRFAQALKIAPVYAEHPKVQSVLVLGSVSRGWADLYSDIEVGILWSEPPSEEDRRKTAERAGGGSRRSPPYNAQIDAWEEEYYVQGLKIDLGHFVTSTLERLIADVIERHDPSLPKQNSVSAILHSIPLYGQSLADGWKQRAANYPDELARAMVREHLRFDPCWILQMLAERDDFLLLSHHLCAIERRIVLVLMGLNHIYYPGHKWLARLISELRLAPVDLMGRLRSLLRDEGRAAVQSLHRLIEDTFSLVEQHMPEIDTAEARGRAREERPRWEQEPTPTTGEHDRHGSSGG